MRQRLPILHESWTKSIFPLQDCYKIIIHHFEKPEKYGWHHRNCISTLILGTDKFCHNNSKGWDLLIVYGLLCWWGGRSPGLELVLGRHSHSYWSLSVSHQTQTETTLTNHAPVADHVTCLDLSGLSSQVTWLLRMRVMLGAQTNAVCVVRALGIPRNWLTGDTKGLYSSIIVKLIQEVDFIWESAFRLLFVNF